MGIPAAFRWLSNRYPKIISPVIEDQPVKMDDGSTIPVDTTRQNPNGEEFDNLYLDMNGIVHPCTHPEDRPAPKDEEEMMLEVFRYTDRVVNMVRPRKLLMIAVDGVAPRAKMNQQRSRRFRSAQEAKEKADEKQELIKLLKQQHGGELPPDSEFNVVKQVFDSNTITPGTPFMDILAISLRYWCQYKLNTDPGWAKLKVIISDATVPGEGEHKIMAFVRSQRASPEHDPNTRHVIYGLDADLIMLGLATHEPHFRVLREDVFFQDSKARMCKICGQKGHDARNCKGEAKEKEGEHDEKDHGVALKPFIWLHVSVLREYLAIELSVPDLPFRFDLERAVDDWIFMCCFVGNDFLPHLPALEIREDGIDTLMAIWRDNLPSMGGYVTKDGHIDMDRAQIIMNGLAKQEDAIFKRRKEQERRREANAKRRKLQNDSSAQNGAPGGGNSARGGGRPKKDQDFTPKHLLRPIESYHEKKLPAIYNQGITHDKVVNRGSADANAANKIAASVLKSQLRGDKPAPAPAAASAAEPAADAETASALGKRKATEALDGTDTPKSTETPGSATPAANEDDEPVDNVRLWEDGYQDRYYQQKFGKDPGDLDFRKSVAHSYAEGLAWVLLYYFQGCPSWEWYYPYHYAPFAADFRDLNQLEISFEKGRIAKPFEQLMSVLPAGSRSAIPDVFHPLMLEENSEIIDFYPQEFETDLNGKKFAWQGVALLPFIDMQRLLSAVESKYHLLSEDDKARNGVGKDILILSDANEGIYDDILTNFYSKKQGAPHFKLNPKNSGGMSGKVAKMEEYVPHGLLQYPLKRKAMPDLDYDSSVTVIYEMPTTSQTHKSMLLRGAKLPPPALNRSDIEIMKSKSKRGGRNHGGAPLGRFDHNTGRHEPVNYGPNGNGQRGGGYRGGRGGSRGGNGGGGYGRGGYNPPHQSFSGAPPPGWQPPPPGGPGFGMGGPPPPPPTYQQQGGRGGYNNGWAPPPGPPGPPGYYGQYQGQPPPPAPSYRGNGPPRDSRRY